MIFLAIGILAFLMWLGPSVAHAYLVKHSDPSRLRLIYPLVLLGFCVMNLITTAGERAVAFSPAEVDFLFAGPFTRRQLLGYKLIKSTFAALLTSLMFSVFLLRYVRSWLAGWVGVFLSLVFLQLLSMSIVFVGQTIGERAFTRGRKLFVLLVGVMLAIALLPVLRHRDGAPHVAGFTDAAIAMRQTPIGRVIVAPFDVFGRVVGATSVWPEMVEWAGIAVLVNLGMLGVVMWLDAHYLEAAAATSQRMYENVRRVRRAGGIALRASRGSGRLRLPTFPRLGGAGPIAWRQLSAALRQSRAVIVMMILLGSVGGPIIYFTTRGDGPGSGRRPAVGAGGRGGVDDFPLRQRAVASISAATST